LFEKVIPYEGKPNGEFNETLNIEKEVKAPIYVMYELKNVYQNHRRWVKSRDWAQLGGKKIDETAIKSRFIFFFFN
jgi:hypothetical protein